MTKYRLTWEKCPDCGRHGVNGGCYMVERRGLFGWSAFLITYDRGGCQQAQHFPTEGAAIGAFQQAVKPKGADYIVVKELRS